MGLLSIIPALKSELSERTAWATQEVKGHPKLHNKIIFSMEFLGAGEMGGQFYRPRFDSQHPYWKLTTIYNKIWSQRLH